MTARGTGLPLDPRRVAAPAVSVVGLVVAAVVGLGLLTGDVSAILGGPGGPDGGPIRTPTPSNVVVVDPRTKVPGSIVFVKAGNIWVQSGERAYQLTSGGRDAMPSWSADGSSVYFIRAHDEDGAARIDGVTKRYRLEVQALMRIAVKDDAAPELLLEGEYTRGASHWTYFLRQPVPAPDGTRLAIISDGPVPSESDVVLKFLDLATLDLTSARAAKDFLLGHQDPAWSPDGRYVVAARNGRDGSRGAPRLLRYDTTTGKSVTITGPGYIGPAWSPDGRFIAATRTDSIGTDIVILNTAGTEVLRVTTDEHSFAPVWSPAGDAIVFFREAYGVVDAWLVRLGGAPGTPTLGETIQLTFAAGLEAGSRPDWHIPPELIPTPPLTSTPAASSGAAATASPAP